MHALTSSFKRAHLASLRLLRQFTFPEGLTPARFDLLYQLHITRYRSPYQWRLAKWLGVSRPTICKMIHAMRAIGILELRIDPKNGHRRRIVLTRLGRKRFARALKSVRRGRVEGAVRSAWRAAELSRSEVGAGIAEMMQMVLRYCRGLGDYTELYRYG